MSLNLVATVRKPTRLLTRDWAASLDAMRRNIRGRTYSDTYFDPLAGAVMLTPQVDPGYWQYGKDGYTLQVWNGASWAAYSNAWTEGENAFGDEGSYIGFAGDSTYPATTPWAAYRADNKYFLADSPMAFTLHWTPPAGTFLPQLQFWPRIDKTQTVTYNGYTYYYSPVGFYLDATNADLVVCEYEYDDLAHLTAGAMINETYRHPLDTTIVGVSGQWVSFMLIPVPETFTASDSKVYYYDDFVLRSPILKNGGFCYRTKIKRKGPGQGGLRLFPQGIAGMRSLTGGMAGMTMPYVYFPSTGYVISQKYSKRQADTAYPTLEWEAYQPSGTALGYMIVDENGTGIVSGSTFQDFWVKVTLTSSTPGNYLSPILYSFSPRVAGEALDQAQDETDISADVNIQESVSEDLIGYRASVSLRNREQQYNELVYRPANEIAFSFGGTNRAVLYTLNPSFPWYRIPTNPALTINWECGDFWTRLKSQYVTNMPDYGNQTIKAAITDYMERIGFDPLRLHIADSLADASATLPWSSGKDDPLCRPQDNSTADAFLSDLYEKWFADYQMYFGADDVGGVLKPALYIEDPPDLQDPASIHRTFYTARAFATAVGEADPYYVCGAADVVFQHDMFFNEIWVFGFEPATENPIADMWLDIYSQTDENYLYYVGERRITAVVTRLPTIEYVNQYLDLLKKMLGRPRRLVTFETKYDPTLRPGDFIKFYGLSMIFKVRSTDTSIDPSRVSQMYDDTVHGCKIEALEWPTQ